MYELRPYQKTAKERILNDWDNGIKNTLIVLPTGTGKTVVFAAVIDTEVTGGKRVLVLAHRGELLDQASAKLKAAYDIDTVLEKAESTSCGSLVPVTVGSVQTMYRKERLDRFPHDYFDVIVVDETHHIMADTYQRILKHFSDAKVLGVTATPDRADKKNLGNFFESKAFEYTMGEAISDGYLCPVRSLMIPLKIDLAKVAVRQGDFVAGDLGTALDPYLEDIADKMAEYCADRKTVVFLPLVSTSKKFAAMLNERGFRAAEVDGESKDRSEILKDFEDGKYNVLCNAMLLTEGWDCPSVDCIVVLRPTKVRSLYQQMVGRGMRLCEGKDHLLLLDFLWLTERHDLCKASSLIAPSKEIADIMDEQLRGEKGAIDICEAMDRAQGTLLAQRETALARELEMQRLREAKVVDPIQFAFSIGSQALADYEPEFDSEKAPATAEQLWLLGKDLIDTEHVTCYGQAELMLDLIAKRRKAALATPKQIKYLEKMGYRGVGKWTLRSANKLITKISECGWEIPKGYEPEQYDGTKDIAENETKYDLDLIEELNASKAFFDVSVTRAFDIESGEIIYECTLSNKTTPHKQDLKGRGYRWDSEEYGTGRKLWYKNVSESELADEIRFAKGIGAVADPEEDNLMHSSSQNIYAVSLALWHRQAYAGVLNKYPLPQKPDILNDPGWQTWNGKVYKPDWRGEGTDHRVYLEGKEVKIPKETADMIKNFQHETDRFLAVLNADVVSGMFNRPRTRAKDDFEIEQSGAGYIITAEEKKKTANYYIEKVTAIRSSALAAAGYTPYGEPLSRESDAQLREPAVFIARLTNETSYGNKPFNFAVFYNADIPATKAEFDAMMDMSDKEDGLTIKPDIKGSALVNVIAKSWSYNIEEDSHNGN